MKSLFCSVLILLALAGQASYGQPQRSEEVLAQGTPPLTLELSDKFIEFFEWSLASKFTKSQRALFALKLVQIWEARDQSKVDALVKMRGVYDGLSKARKEEWDEAQRQLQTFLLNSLPNEAAGSLGELLYSVYTSSHPEAAAGIKRTQVPDSRPAAGSVTSLVGEWVGRAGTGGSYVNPTTGQHSGPNATVESYKIFANGTYEHSMLMQSSLYNCTTTIFGREIGPLQIQGDSLTINPRPGTIETKNTCSPHLNQRKQTNFPPKTFRWRIQQGQFGLQLCLNNPERGDSCFDKQ